MLGEDILFIAKPIYRPFRAGAFLNRYLGVKPQAESYCPFGAETKYSNTPSFRGTGFEDDDEDENEDPSTPLLHFGAEHLRLPR
jgi:hypothetical protein